MTSTNCNSTALRPKEHLKLMSSQKKRWSKLVFTELSRICIQLCMFFKNVIVKSPNPLNAKNRFQGFRDQKRGGPRYQNSVASCPQAALYFLSSFSPSQCMAVNKSDVFLSILMHRRPEAYRYSPKPVFVNLLRSLGIDS
jgi:hypothetical protein